MKLAVPLLLVLLLGAAPRPAMTAIPTPVPTAGESEPSWPTEAPALASPSPTVDRMRPSGITGIASWGWGWTGVVTRLPRGTRITVCGVRGCWSGRSVGYGPAVWTHRIADLSRSVFAAICGAPSKGLCRVTLSW